MTTTTTDAGLRALNTIIYDVKLFTDEERHSYRQRFHQSPDEVLKEAKATEQERWKIYKQNNPFQL